MKILRLISSHERRPDDQNVVDMAAFLGASVEVADTSDRPATCAHPSLWNGMESSVAVAIHADTLMALYQGDDSSRELQKRLFSACAVFLYGVAAERHGEMLRWLTNGEIMAI